MAESAHASKPQQGREREKGNVGISDVYVYQFRFLQSFFLSSGKLSPQPLCLSNGINTAATSITLNITIGPTFL